MDGRKFTEVSAGKKPRSVVNESMLPVYRKKDKMSLLLTSKSFLLTDGRDPLSRLHPRKLWVRQVHLGPSSRFYPVFSSYLRSLPDPKDTTESVLRILSSLLLFRPRPVRVQHPPDPFTPVTNSPVSSSPDLQR